MANRTAEKPARAITQAREAAPARPEPEKSKIRLNSLWDLLEGVTGGVSSYAGNQTLSLPYTLANANAYTPLSLNRVTLSYAFMTHGIVQKLVTKPVKDAFKHGFKIKTGELDKEEISKLMSELKRNRRRDRDQRLGRNTSGMGWQAASDFGNSDLGAVKKTRAWARLYGGAGLVVNTAQRFDRELDPEALTPDTPLEFIDADRWELIMSQTNIWDELNPKPFNYYGLPLHRSRVVKTLGVEAPAYIRLRLQGWGMSALECCVRSLQAYLKFENVVFELLDESKIDVFQITGLSAATIDQASIEKVTSFLAAVQRWKNFQNGIVMDKEDIYEQKKLGEMFSGLAGLWDQLRFNLCCDSGIPMNVLFGMASTGFSGGEDSLKNYNSLVDAEREDAEPLLCEVIDLRCQQMFGFVPEYEVEWPPLAEIPAPEQEQVKTSTQNRKLALFDRALMTGQELMNTLDKDGLIEADETEVGQGVRDVEPQLAMDQSNQEQELDIKKKQATQKPAGGAKGKAQ